MTPTDLRDAFASLRLLKSESGCLRARNLFDGCWVYLTDDDRPGLLLAEADSEDRVGPVQFAAVVIRRHVATTIDDGRLQRDVRGAVVQCTASDEAVHELFIRLLVVAIEPNAETTADVVEEVLRRLRRLLAAVATHQVRDLQGLWAELLTIRESLEPSAAITAWHVDPVATFDFLQGDAAVEVKSTRGTRPIHRFSSAQLVTPPATVVISYVLQLDDAGPSILDLLDECTAATLGGPETVKLAEQVLGAIGERSATAASLRFNDQVAVARRHIYRASELPGLRGPFPREVSNVEFDLDLSGSPDATLSAGDPDLWRLLLGQH